MRPPAATAAGFGRLTRRRQPRDAAESATGGGRAPPSYLHNLLSMKTIFQSKLVRGLSMLALGVLLVNWSDDIPEVLVRVCGALFVFPAFVSLIAYYRTAKHLRGSAFMPVVSMGSTLFGAILLIFPSFFVTALMYILAGVLLLTGSSQFFTLWSMRNDGYVVTPLAYFVPLATFGAGLFAVLKPGLTASLPFIILGVAFIVNSLLDLWTLYMRRRRTSRAVKPV